MLCCAGFFHQCGIKCDIYTERKKLHELKLYGTQCSSLLLLMLRHTLLLSSHRRSETFSVAAIDLLYLSEIQLRPLLILLITEQLNRLELSLLSLYVTPAHSPPDCLSLCI